MPVPGGPRQPSQLDASGFRLAEGDKFARAWIYATPAARPQPPAVQAEQPLPEVVRRAVEGPVLRTVAQVRHGVVSHLLAWVPPARQRLRLREEAAEPLGQLLLQQGAVERLEQRVVNGLAVRACPVRGRPDQLGDEVLRQVLPRPVHLVLNLA